MWWGDDKKGPRCGVGMTKRVRDVGEGDKKGPRCGRG